MKHTHHTNNKSLDIKILGTRTSGQKLVVSTLNRYLTKANIKFSLEQIDEVNIFLKEKLESIPSIKIGKEIIPLKSNGSFIKSLRDAVNTILKKSDYGDLNKVIIPIDFSDTSTNAFMYGLRLSSDMEAITKALHVYFPTSKEYTASSVLDIDASIERKLKLKEFVSNFDLDWGADLNKTYLIDEEFNTGFPAEEIISTSTSSQAKLIVMGTTGDSSLLKHWIGSISLQVVKESPIPVLLVPPQAKYKPFRKILLGYDNEEDLHDSLSQLSSFTEHIDSEIHVVHIAEKIEDFKTSEIQNRISAAFPDNKIYLKHICGDDVISCLEIYAAKNSIDIIALVPKKKSFFDALFEESITKKMSIHTTLPLLVLNPAT